MRILALPVMGMLLLAPGIAGAVQKGAPGEIEQGSCNCTGGTGWCHVEGLSPMECVPGKYPDGSSPCTGTCKIEAPPKIYLRNFDRQRNNTFQSTPRNNAN